MKFDWGTQPHEDDFVIRQSAVSNGELCGGRNGLALDQPQTPPSEAMFGGTAIHLVVDHLIDNIMDPGTHPMDHESIFSELADLAQEKDGFDLASRFSSPAIMQGWVEHCIGMGNQWLEDWGIPNMATIEQAIVREDQLFMPLGLVTVNPGGSGERGVRVWLSGHPDLATPDLIVDWKTSSRAWAKGKAQAAIQDDLYALLVEHNYPDVEIFNGLFVVGNRATGRWDSHPTRITQASKEAALHRAFLQGQQLLLGTWTYSPLDGFGKRGWHCKPEYCGSWDVCPARRIGDDYETDTQVTRTDWM